MEKWIEIFPNLRTTNRIIKWEFGIHQREATKVNTKVFINDIQKHEWENKIQDGSKKFKHID